MLNIIEKDGKQFVSAKNLYQGLELDKSNYSKWAEKHIVNSVSKYKDFHSHLSTSEQKGRGKFAQDYLLSKNFAKFLCTTSGSPNALPYIEWLIGIDNKVEAGELLNATQIIGLIQLIPCFAIAELRDEAKKHTLKCMAINTIGTHTEQTCLDITQTS